MSKRLNPCNSNTWLTICNFVLLVEGEVTFPALSRVYSQLFRNSISAANQSTTHMLLHCIPEVVFRPFICPTTDIPARDRDFGRTINGAPLSGSRVGNLLLHNLPFHTWRPSSFSLSLGYTSHCHFHTPSSSLAPRLIHSSLPNVFDNWIVLDPSTSPQMDTESKYNMPPQIPITLDPCRSFIGIIPALSSNKLPVVVVLRSMMGLGIECSLLLLKFGNCMR